MHGSTRSSSPSNASSKGREQQKPALLSKASTLSTPSATIAMTRGGEDDVPGNESDSDESLDGLVDRVSGIGVGEKKDARSVLRSQLRKGKGRSLAALRPLPSASTPTASGTSQSGKRTRRYYVLSTAGKLVYTNDAPDGTDDHFAFVGVIQALVSVFLDGGDKLKLIETESGTRVAFLLRPPLYLVLASDWHEPVAQLRTHLDYLHHCVLALVTQAQLSAVFRRRSNYDLRRLLEGTDAIFATLVRTLSNDLNTSLATIAMARCDPLDLLYMLLLCPKLVTLVRPRSHSIHPSDLHLLLASLPGRTSTGEQDSDTSFYPFCLPKFNNQGFLYVYASWKGGIGLVIVRSERDVDQSRQLDAAVRQRLVERKLTLSSFTLSASSDDDTDDNDGGGVHVSELNLPGLRHFVYKHRLAVQLVEASYANGDYAVPENKDRLVTLYEHAHDALRSSASTTTSSTSATSSSPASTTVTATATMTTTTAVGVGSRMAYYVTAHESVYASSTSTAELYVAASPLLPKRAIVALARGVAKWVKDHERELFLLGAPSF